MALMFPRSAHNYAKNGYYATDSDTVERILNWVVPASDTQPMRILDPCAGEGLAIAELAQKLNRKLTQVFAVEYNAERAFETAQRVDHCLHSDLFDTVISSQEFSALWLNPPYGALTSENTGAPVYQGKGVPRLEKAFYQRCLSLLQYGGVLIFIIPLTALDEEMSSWLCQHFSQLAVYEAVDKTYKQLVILGIRKRVKEINRQDRQAMQAHLQAITEKKVLVETVPVDCDKPYKVPSSRNTTINFYRVSIEPVQFKQEIKRLAGLWPDFNLHLRYKVGIARPPVTKMSDWHLALALAAGAISGIVKSSKTGRILLIKGDTYKTKQRTEQIDESSDGVITQSIILLDRFVPVIKAWDMTPGSLTIGQLLTISQSSGNDLSINKFSLGQVVMTPGIRDLIEDKNHHHYVMRCLERHSNNDWGDLSVADNQLNQDVLSTVIDGKITDGRFFSAYQIDENLKIWIISEWHEDIKSNVTTLLFPDEY